MHRSGTSVVTRALQCLGVNLGDRLMPPGADNPKGFFEDMDVVNINDRLLRQLNSAWHSPPTFSDDTLSAIARLSAGKLGVLARRTLSLKISDDLPFGIKDPRLCVLLHFWRPVFRDLNLQVSALVVLRNPLSVAASLRRRNALTPDRSLDLWLRYMLAAVTDIEPYWRTTVVEYESIISSPYFELERVARELELTPDREDVTAFARSFLGERLSQACEDEIGAACPNAVSRTYNLLREVGEGSAQLADASARFITYKAELSPTLPDPACSESAREATGEKSAGKTVLVHLATGIGNIVFATPLLQVLASAGFVVDVLLDADYAGVGELLQGWSAVRTVYDGRCERVNYVAYTQLVVAVPPFSWGRYAPWYAQTKGTIPRPPDILFYRNEQAYYLDFARRLGCNMRKPPYYFLPVSSEDADGDRRTIVLAPGCKPEAMAAKRWPFFPELAASFEDVVVVGTNDDLLRFDGSPMAFPKHARSFVGSLTLRETAAVIARARVVVGNDSGLGHIAGALGVPTILLFGPTPDRTLGHLPLNVTVMRTDLECEPCWFERRFHACNARVDCLNRLSLDSVVRRVEEVGKIAPIANPTSVLR